MATLTELQRESDWRRFKTDPEFWFRTQWFIKHPEHGRMLFELRDAQVRALRHWQEHRYSLTLKARQIGYSTLVAAWAFYNVFFYPDREIILISRTEREATDLLRKAKYGFDQLPEWIIDKGPRSTADHQQKIMFANGSQLLSMPSASDPARGSTAWLIAVDEWAFLPDGEDAWASIEPVADVGGRVIGLSTANGSGNFFHQLWVGATTGANLFAPLFQSWRAESSRDDAWYESKKASMLPWQLAQEYPNTPEEAFIKSGNPVFDLDVLADHETQYATEPSTGWLVAA